MYRVIIVEDELLVRMGLKNSVDWGRFGMQVAADAADGKTALELYEKLKPDLIITDLNMPVMSGMEMISRIRERDREVKIVILTCLEEFELARKAVSLGVTDYIVKHMMTEEHIAEILSGVASQLSAGKYRKAAYELNEANAEIVKEKHVKDLVLSGRRSGEADAMLSEKLDPRGEGGGCLLCAMKISHYDKIKSPIVRDSVLSLLRDALSYHGKDGFALEDDGGYLLLFACAKDAAPEEAAPMLGDIEASVKGLLDTAVSFALAGPGPDASRLHELYRQALLSLEDVFFGGPGVYGAMIPFERDGAVLEKTEEMLRSCERSAAGPAGVYAEYFSRIRSIAGCGLRAGREYREAYGALIQWAAGAVKFPGEGNEKMALTALSALSSVERSETIDEALRALYVFYTQFSSLIRKRQITSREVKLAVEYVEANFGSDLSLQGVADRVCLSPNYLSALFKKEMNAGFTDFLTEVRIEKAKELLLDTYLKTYEIAESVGYRENAYFCKTFKKVTGKTPGEFRRQWLKKWLEEPEDEAREAN